MVMVIIIVVGELVTRQAVPEFAFRRNATFGEQLKSSVHGGVADALVPCSHDFEQVLDRHVRSTFEEGFYDHAPLSRGAELFPRHIKLQPLAEPGPKRIIHGPVGGLAHRAHHAVLF